MTDKEAVMNEELEGIGVKLVGLGAGKGFTNEAGEMVAQGVIPAFDMGGETDHPNRVGLHRVVVLEVDGPRM